MFFEFCLYNIYAIVAAVQSCVVCCAISTPQRYRRPALPPRGKPENASRLSLRHIHMSKSSAKTVDWRSAFFRQIQTLKTKKHSTFFRMTHWLVRLHAEFRAFNVYVHPPAFRGMIRECKTCQVFQSGNHAASETGKSGRLPI